MRVLTITNMYPRADRPGWGSFVKTQVDSLTALGIEHDILVIDGFKSRLAYAAAFPRMWWRLATRRYDLIHAHYGLSGLVARAQLGTPVVVSFCGDDLYGHPDRSGQPTPTSLFWVRLHKWLARHVDAVIVKSRAMRDILGGVDAHVIPNGVDLAVFRPLPKDECRRQLGLALDTRYVLFPYDPKRIRKNFGIVREAVDRLNADGGARFEVLVVSDRPNTEIPLFMNAADVLVLVSFWEGSPNVVKEAMACNLRIVSADVGDVREITAGVGGCVTCSRSADDVAAKIREVLAPGVHSDGQKAMTELSLQRVAERVRDVYAAAIGGRRKRWVRVNAES